MNKIESQLLIIISISLAFFGCFIIPVEALSQGRDKTSQIDDRRRSELAVATGVTCSPGFSWMDNDKGQSPCLVAAYVEGTCTEGVWTVPPLQPGDHYNPPNTTTSTVNGCSCSWSSYNLLSACTACQGQNSSILTWVVYSAECPSSDSNSFFPSGYTLSNDTSIPHWAATNPNDWSSAAFDVDQALTLANEDLADIIPVASKNSSTSQPSLVGPIIGGVVGGVAILVIASVVGFLFYRRKKDAKQFKLPADLDENENTSMVGSSAEMQPHMPRARWPSHSSYSTLMTEAPSERGGRRYPSPGGYSLRSYVTRTSSPYSISITSLPPEGVPVV